MSCTNTQHSVSGLTTMGVSRDGDRGYRPLRLGNSQVAMVFLRNGTDPLQKQMDPCGPIASRGRFVRPFVKYVID